MSFATKTREIDERSRVTIPADWAKEMELETGSDVLLVYRPALREITIKKLELGVTY